MWTERALERLEDLVALQERAAGRGRHAEFILHDDAFHRVISELSGYERLWPTINRCKAHLDRVRHLSTPLSQHAAKAVAQHRAILKALASGEPERAAKAMTHHLDDAYARLSVVLERHAGDVRLARSGFEIRGPAWALCIPRLLMSHCDEPAKVF